LLTVYRVGSGLYINVTNRCSNACDFCVRNKDYYGDLWLNSEPSAEQILSDILAHNLSEFSEIVFCGYGEPTERLDTCTFIAKELKKNCNLPIRINTNGQSDLINNRDTTNDFIGLFDTVSISLNQANARKYQKVCHSKYGESAYNSIINFAKKLAKNGVNVIMTVVKTTLPDDDIPICQKIAEEAGAKFRVRDFL